MSRSLKADWGRNSMCTGMKSNTVRIQERLIDTDGIKSLLVKQNNPWNNSCHEKNLFLLFIKQSTCLLCPDNRIPYSTKSPSGGASHPATVPSNGKDSFSEPCMVSVHSPGKGRELTPHFSFSQKTPTRSSSISLARIWVLEEPKQPWSSFSSLDSSSWSSQWFSPSDCALQGGRWHIGKFSPARSPRMLCELAGLPRRGNWTRHCSPWKVHTVSWIRLWSFWDTTKAICFSLFKWVVNNFSV